MDAVWEGPLQATTELKEPPSNYFRRQCWISADSNERALSHLIEYIGADRFFWGTDYPHPDHTRDYIDRLKGLIQPLSLDFRAKILSENIDKVYRLT